MGQLRLPTSMQSDCAVIVASHTINRKAAASNLSHSSHAGPAPPPLRLAPSAGPRSHLRSLRSVVDSNPTYVTSTSSAQQPSGLHPPLPVSHPIVSHQRQPRGAPTTAADRPPSRLPQLRHALRERRSRPKLQDLRGHLRRGCFCFLLCQLADGARDGQAAFQLPER